MIVSLLRLILTVSFGLTSALASSSQCEAAFSKMQDCSQCCCDHGRDISHESSCGEEWARWKLCLGESHSSSDISLREVSFQKDFFDSSYKDTFLSRGFVESLYGAPPTVPRFISAYPIARTLTALLHNSLSNCQNAPPQRS